MKLIVKGDEPSFFQNWNKSKPSGANWKDFSGTQVYQELRRYLINEQALWS